MKKSYLIYRIIRIRLSLRLDIKINSFFLFTPELEIVQTNLGSFILWNITNQNTKIKHVFLFLFLLCWFEQMYFFIFFVVGNHWNSTKKATGTRNRTRGNKVAGDWQPVSQKNKAKERTRILHIPEPWSLFVVTVIHSSYRHSLRQCDYTRHDWLSSATTSSTKWKDIRP